MLQTKMQLIMFSIILKVSASLIVLSDTAHNGGYIREKYGSVGVVYLDSGPESKATHTLNTEESVQYSDVHDCISSTILHITLNAVKQ